MTGDQSKVHRDTSESYHLARDGFEVIRCVLNAEEVEDLRRALSSLSVSPGYRNLMRRVPMVAALASSDTLKQLLRKLPGGPFFAVRSIFFDKTVRTNWLVPWHQDISIAVDSCLYLPGYGPWSIKDGIQHVQPPVEILESMVTLRIHLDECDASNGALRVVPGSHRRGKLSASEVLELRRLNGETTVDAHSGDVLVMRPLLLHASSPALSASHRWVVHLEYATSKLPPGLDWYEISQGKGS